MHKHCDSSNSDGDVTFESYGETLWWGFVTMTTIGYGDISPKTGVSQLATGIMCIVCIALFGTAASIVGVGLTLQVEQNNLHKQQAKIRPLAARVIQTFMRQHLMFYRFGNVPMYR